MITKNNLKFFTVAMITNLILIFIVSIINSLLLEEFIQPGTFITQKIGGRDFMFLSDFYLKVFWYVAPFCIFIFKHYRKHYILFIIVGVVIVFLFQVYLYVTSNTYNALEIVRAFKESTLYLITISLTIHLSQMIIGKRLLPTLYNNH